MANDRLFIGCTECGDTLFVGKYYPSPGFDVWPGQEPPLGDWITGHIRRHLGFPVDLSEQPFVVASEADLEGTLLRRVLR